MNSAANAGSNVGLNARYTALQVTHIVNETADAKSLVFGLPADMPPALREKFNYQPGQFLTLRLPIGGRHVPRCYSMSSTPGLDQGLRVTVKRVVGGRGSNWLCDQLKVGDQIEVLPPSGVFTPRDLQGDFLLFAGGSGITPVFSILRAVLAQGTGRVLLVYANRDTASIIFHQALQTLLNEHGARLQVVHWLDAVQGLPSVAQLADLARDWTAAQAFICGPSPFMRACEDALQSLAMDEDRVHVERFVSLPDEEDSPATEVLATDVLPTNVEVTYGGQVLTFTCAANETVLDAALRAKIDLPYSCAAGMCASCMCQVVEGSVFLRANDALDQRDLDKAWTLSCQALPTSPHLKLKFA